MTKLVYVTDTHFRTQTPVNRNDDILESLLEKWEWVCEYTSKIGASLLHGGDLFHTPNVPDFVAQRVIRSIKKNKIDCYFIIGNHDVSGGNVIRYDYSKIGLMAEYPWFHLVGKEPKFFKDCIVCGYDFRRDMECPNIINPVEDFRRIKEVSGLNGEKRPKPIICMMHSMITDEPPVVIDGKHKTIHWDSIQCTADVILSGHYHPGWEGIKESKLYGTRWINPGAMIRQEASKIDMTRKPQIVVLKIKNGQVDIKIKTIPHKRDVFDIDLIGARDAAKEERNKFIEALNAIKDEDIASGNIMKILDNMSANNQTWNCDTELVHETVIDFCRKRIQELMEG